MQRRLAANAPPELSEFMKSPGGNGLKDNLFKISEYQKQIHEEIRGSGVRGLSRSLENKLDKYKDYGLTKQG